MALETIVESLSALTPGHQDIRVFEQFCRLMPLPAFELVLHPEDSTQEVLMLERGSKDRWWPNMVGIPGAMLVSDPKKMSLVFEELVQRELGHIYISSEPKLVGVEKYWTRRGFETALIHTASFRPSSSQDLYNVQKLPPNTIGHHRPIIKTVVKSLDG